MNNLLDLVQAWANKLTYRILSISGASDQAKQNYLNAVSTQNQQIIDADSELSGKIPVIKILIWGGAGILIVLALKYLSILLKNKRY